MILSNPLAVQTPPIKIISSTVSRCYEDQDFRHLYEQKYFDYEVLRRNYDCALNQIDYWKEKFEKANAEKEYLRKLHFGKKTEKSIPPRTQPQQTQSKDTKPKKHGAQNGHKGHGRNIPIHLPQEEMTHEIPDEKCHCQSCGYPFKDFPDEEISYEVDIEVRYVLVVHKRKKYKKTCRCPHPIVTAPGPVKLFEGGLYSMDFWIQVLLDKYAYGMPIERQVMKMKLEGLDVSKGVLTAGILRMAPYLKALYELLLEQIAFEKLVHADETRWYNWASRYEEQRREESSKHWLWGLFSKRYHVFIIDPSRGAQVMKDNLGQGEAKTIIPTLVCDRYSSYKALNTLLAFCWAHVRRDFIKLKTQYPDDEQLVKWSEAWLGLIGELYGLNHLRLKHQDDTAVFNAYQNQIREVLERMQTLMDASYTKAPQKAQVKSMKNHWKGLTLFVDDPEIPMDNNLAERELRGPVVGRKNFYGNHSDRGAQATAIFYSIISSCKLHKVSPKKFLKRFLTTCAAWQSRGSPLPKELLESFLPHEYVKRYPSDLLKG